MAKELPYFQFEPAQYLTGNIQFCSLETQGLFTNVCAIYWQRECNLTLSQIKKKFDKIDSINELIENEVLKVDADNIIIEFLDEQFETISNSKLRLSAAGKKGALIKKQATLKPPLNDVNATLQQLDKIKEDKIKEDKIKDTYAHEIKNKDIYRAFAHLKISFLEFDKLRAAGYSQIQIDNILNQIENYAKNKNYKNLYLTAINWLNKETQTKPVSKIEKGLNDIEEGKLIIKNIIDGNS